MDKQKTDLQITAAYISMRGDKARPFYDTMCDFVTFANGVLYGEGRTASDEEIDRLANLFANCQWVRPSLTTHLQEELNTVRTKGKKHAIN